MTHKRATNPLRLEPPTRHADAALGERLALLARASTPTRVRRRAAWRAPLAGLAIVVGTGGLAYGAQSVVDHISHPAVVVPSNELSPSADSSAENSADASSIASPAGESMASQPVDTSSHGAGDNGLHVGRGHAKGSASAPGHSGTAPGQQQAKTRGKSADAPGKTHLSTNGAAGPKGGATGKGQSTNHGKRNGVSHRSRGHGG